LNRPPYTLQVLIKLAQLIEDNAEELAQLETLDNGKPLAMAKAADLPLSSDHFLYYAGENRGGREMADMPGRRAGGSTLPRQPSCLHFLPIFNTNCPSSLLPAGWADKLHGKTIPCDNIFGKFLAYTLHEPIG